MWHCPVCEKENSNLLCSGCGFDGSCDYEKHPSLARPVKRPAPVSRYRAALKENSAEKLVNILQANIGQRNVAQKASDSAILRCAKCGGTQFSVDVKTGELLCSACGHRFSMADSPAKAAPQKAEPVKTSPVLKSAAATPPPVGKPVTPPPASKPVTPPPVGKPVTPPPVGKPVTPPPVGKPVTPPPVGKPATPPPASKPVTPPPVGKPATPPPAARPTVYAAPPVIQTVPAKNIRGMLEKLTLGLGWILAGLVAFTIVEGIDQGAEVDTLGPVVGFLALILIMQFRILRKGFCPLFGNKVPYGLHNFCYVFMALDFAVTTFVGFHFVIVSPDQIYSQTEHLILTTLVVVMPLYFAFWALGQRGSRKKK